MKQLLIFLLGGVVGAGGMLLWLRKDIKKELQTISAQMEKESKKQKEKEDLPFDIEDNKKEETKKPAEVEIKMEENVIDPATRTQYHNLVNEVRNREPEEENNDGGYFVEGDETNGTFVEIDCDEYLHNHEYEQEKLVYYRGSRTMATENGSIIPNPFPLIGGEWENCVGNYAFNTAFIRNNKTMVDYEIYVDEGLYEDEYGNDLNFE